MQRDPIAPTAPFLKRLRGERFDFTAAANLNPLLDAPAPLIPAPPPTPTHKFPIYTMPYGKRKFARRPSYSRRPYRRRGMRLDAGARLVAASYTKQLKRQAALGKAAAFAESAGQAAAQVTQNIAARQAYDQARGRGSYKFGNIARDYTNWAKSSTGRAIRGIGADLLHKYTGIGLDGRGLYTGRGNYTDNALIDDGMGVAEEVPSFNGSGDETGAVTVSRKEYICDIYGPTSAFNVQTFELNPGLEQTFPWLSQIAMNYDEYDFKQLMFTFRSTTTDIGTTSNGQCGTVIMATNYNAAAAPFEDKVIMMEYDAAMSCKLTESMRHGVECDPAKLSGSEGKYVRNNPVIMGQDVKTYDHGIFQLGIANSPGTAVIPATGGFVNQSVGELWVSYTVTLRKPKFYSSRGLGISQDLFVSENASETTTFPFGTTASYLLGQQNNINCILTMSTNALKITFPASYAGFLEVKLCMEGITTTGSSIPSLTQTGQVININDQYGGRIAAGDAPNAVQSNTFEPITAGCLFYCLHIQVGIATGGIENTCQFNFATITVAPTQSSLTINEYNSGFSYKALNIGALGSQSLAPVLITQQGAIRTPS